MRSHNEVGPQLEQMPSYREHNAENQKKKNTKAKLMKTCIQCINNVKSSFWIGTYERSTWSKSKPQSLGLFHSSFSAMYIVLSNKRCPLKIAAFGTKKIN